MIISSWVNQETEKETDLESVKQIRRTVFVEEYKLSESYLTPDIDAHILLIKDGKTPVATGRILPFRSGFLLGQIAVLSEHRGQHFGDFVVRLLIRKTIELGASTQFVYAQPQATGFYEKLGFVFVDETLENSKLMKRVGDIKGNCI